MITITATEFEKDFDKYMVLAQKEEIEVTQNGKRIFATIPNKKLLLLEWSKYYGTLPKEAYDDDIDKE